MGLTPKQVEGREVLRTHKYTLLSGGSRSGKTYLLCHMLAARALNTKSRHAILRFHFNDVKRSIAMDTLPKVLEHLHVPYTLNKTDWVFQFANGSEIWIGGLDDKDRVEKILGNEYSTIYINEASQVSYQAYQTALTRLAENPPAGHVPMKNRVYIDCNPPEKSHWLYALFKLHVRPDNRNVRIENPHLYGYLDMNPIDNPYLPADYITETLSSMDERQRARFRDGEWLDRRQGALWSIDTIAGFRVDCVPDLVRVVVAVDPAVTANEDSDETGIIVAGISADSHVYVLADYSISASPAVWARQVAEAFRRHNADRVIAEVNQGGDLVERNLQVCDRALPYKQIRATRGKAIRAEPVASLYEQGRVHHVGIFRELETQMVEWSPAVVSYSPDRLDALVWAVTELTTGSNPIASPVYQSVGGFSYE